jgi:4-alpha-glucanotransferase
MSEPPAAGILSQREAGILLHPTSLPTGVIGPDAGRFLDFLARAGCRVWQMLPLGPTGAQLSPYSPVSVFAGNVALLPQDRTARSSASALADFIETEHGWLPDYAMFVVLKRVGHGAEWWRWPRGARDREPAAIARLRRRHRAEIAAVCADQFAFRKAWQCLREQAAAAGIRLYGDLPMFPVADSADVWANRELFKLGADGRAAYMAGVPPDAFAEDGQYWGNPVFDWTALRAHGFGWWRQRVIHEFTRVDLLRWDHFRGLVATWEIPRGACTAREGQWREVPGQELLEALANDLGRLPIVAENLGIITPEVEELRRGFALPGMHVLQFAFDGSPDNPHRPERHEEQGVASTGTHDNDTTLGWFRSLDRGTRERVLELTGGRPSDMPWSAVRTVLGSCCRLAIVPMQDFLALDSRHRMNRPGVAGGNWTWRLAPDALTPALADRIAEAVAAADRSP